MKYFRYALLLAATLSISFIYSNRVAFSITVLCQKEQYKTTENYYLLDKTAEKWMFTITALGMFVGPIPLYFVYKLDTRILIIFYATLAFLSCALFPLADSFGFMPALFCRFLSGVAQAVQLNFINEVAQRWAPEAEISLFVAVLLATAHFGPLFIMIFGGEMCESSWFGWEWTYYFLAILIFSSTAVFIILYTDEVHMNRFVEGDEKKLILAGKQPEKEKPSVPWRPLLEDPTIWAIIILFCGFYFGMIIYQQYSPIFFREVLHFPVRSSGYFAAIPMIFAIIVKVIVAKMIDSDPFQIGKSWSLALPLVILEFVSSVLIILAGILIEARHAVLILDMAFASIHFFVPIITSRAFQIRAGPTAHFAINISVVLSSIVHILIPFLVDFVAPNNTKQEWATMFFIVAFVILITTGIYLFFSDLKPAPWLGRLETVTPPIYMSHRKDLPCEKEPKMRSGSDKVCYSYFVMSPVTLLAVSLLIYLLFKHFKKRSEYPKGPIPIPLFGNLPEIFAVASATGGIVPAFNHFKKKYGRVFTLWIGPIPTVHICDYELAFETMTTRGAEFGTRSLPGVLNDIRFGRGVLASNGEFWMEHRRFALFTLRNFGVGRNVMERRIMDEVHQRFTYLNEKNVRIKDNSVDVVKFFDLLVGSIINSMLFSERFEANDKTFAELKRLLDESLQEFNLLDLFAPMWLMKSPLLRWRYNCLMGPFHGIVNVVKRQIAARVEEIEQGRHVIADDPDDFVDAYLLKMQKNKENGEESSTFDLENLSIDLLDLWIAGQETTTTTLVWATVLLLNHPKEEERVRRELLSVTGGRDLSLSDRSATPNLNALIAEVQRIASILNINLLRCVNKDTTIDGQPLAAGTVVTAQLSAIHTDETLFEDSHEFKPSRFLKNPKLEPKLIPFGIGKRVCLGESLARAELYLILGNLLLRYRLKPEGALPSTKETSPFGMMKRPMKCRAFFEPIPADFQ
ncbi:unnamed protein product [Caenorhabditis auriculariae]|uniref:Major facilitator superfamily (MFS) profile domain-containing protein n=1 Tax=Caenorhabditis auriculariae TaxID=2777116 RepID=A0A8S1GVB9_9PELO|nr:unnamed protein product [Caenorhabditis auriculariae]